VLAVIAGKDPLDPSSTDAPKRDGVKAGGASGMRIARLHQPDDKLYARDALDPLLDAACDVFTAMGATVETIDPKNAPWPQLPLEQAASCILNGDVRSAFEAFIASGKMRELADKTHREGKSLDGTPDPSGAIYVKAQRVRRMAVEAADALFAKYDAIVAQNMAAVPSLLGKNLDEQFPDGDPLGALGALAGLPAIAVPMGFTGADGKRLVPGAPSNGKLPVSMVIAARAFDEAKLISLASAFQSKTHWHEERPPHA